MARARNIKPSFFKNELLGQADPLTGLLFISLWTLADKAGRLEDRPLRIKAETFPYRENLDINGYLTELVSLGFIDRYEVDGKKIIQIVNFSKHQTPHSTEKASELPEKPLNHPLPLNNESAAVNGHINVLNPDSLLLNPDSLNTDSLIPGSSTPDGVDSAPKVARPRKSTIPDGFGISDRVRRWALENGHENLEIHLQSFVLKATAKGYKYVDWDAAFMNAIRDDWAKVSQNKVFEFKSSGQRRLENTDKAVKEFLGEQPDSANVIDGEYSHA